MLKLVESNTWGQTHKPTGMLEKCADNDKTAKFEVISTGWKSPVFPLLQLQSWGAAGHRYRSRTASCSSHRGHPAIILPSSASLTCFPDQGLTQTPTTRSLGQDAMEQGAPNKGADAPETHGSAGSPISCVPCEYPVVPQPIARSLARLKEVAPSTGSQRQANL